MSGSFFKKSLAASNIKIQASGSGGRSVHNEDFNDGSMDDQYDRQSYGGKGPRTISYRARGRGRGRGGFRNNYSQHDDRDNRTLTERLGERMGYRGRGRDKKGRRGGYIAQRHQDQGHSKQVNGPQWYQVTIPYGTQAGKDFIYESINELLDIPFQPISYKEEGKASVFYVELSFSSIEALKAVNKRITMPNGFKMMVTVRQETPPVPKVVEGALMEKLLSTMNELYIIENKVLDLSALHKHESLKPDFLPLNRPQVMTSVVSIICEHIAQDLVALNLSNNRLSSLVHLEKAVSSTPNLQGLDLSNNPELRESELDRLKGWNLTEINLTGTSIAKRNSDDFNTYLSNVRKRFPNIVILDGNNAPPPIKFEIEEAEEKRLPVPKFNFFGVDNECQSLVMRFIEQYIQLFDSNERSNLIEAYHDRVTFSTSFWFYPDENAKQHRFDIGSSRNLMRIPPQERNGKRVHYGKEAVVKFLAEEFPETNHLMETINADVIHHSPQMLSFTITGLYEESRSSKSFKVTRLFSRNFTAVYQGAGIVIISEQLSFSNANPDRRGRMVANGSKRSAAALSSQPSVSTVSAPVDETAQNAMVQRFMVDSGMNAHYSRECLVVHNWNYEEAGKKFTILKAEGKIPPDAYC